MQAVNVLRSREHERSIAMQQRQLAEQRGVLVDLYRQVTSAQRQQTFQANLRLSGLIHDHSVPQLAVLLHTIEQQQAIAPPAQQDALVRLTQHTREIERELRRIARELRPPGVGQQLRYALEHLVMEWEQQHPMIQFEYHFTADETWLSEFQRDTIYMIVQQLGENALKHAAALLIDIQVTDEEQHLMVEVRDNGRGFVYAPETIRPDALGILIRHDMARELGGTLTIDTRPGAGCRVQLSVPYGDGARMRKEPQT
jgi:signal transduction histidine kinase